MKISIDPRTNVVYASIYILGLYETYGRKNVSYNCTPFKDLQYASLIDDYHHYFAFYNHDTKKRYIVDFRDKNDLAINALKWTDIYGKVNFNSKTSENQTLPLTLASKIVPLGPNFGIKIYNDFTLYFLLFRNFLSSKLFLNFNLSLRQFSTSYNWMRRREPLESYTKVNNYENDYVFHLSTFYTKQNHGDIANLQRANFIRACRKVSSIRFEGGLVHKLNDLSNYIQFEDVLIGQYLDGKTYNQNIRKSCVVYNTPSAWGCHGWKLGEYFAMGKVIISSPFFNDVPVGIINNTNIILAKNENEVFEMLDYLVSNQDLHTKISFQSKQYFNNYISPKASISRLVNASNN